SGYFTFDGAATWDGSEQGTGGPNSGDPAAAIGNNGWFYVGYIASNSGQGCAYSTDNGSNWTHVQVANPTGGLLDKNHMWIDNSPSSPYDGYLYSTWTDLGSSSPNYADIMIARTIDNGLSWETAQNISDPLNAGSHNQGINVQTGPNGEVYALWAVYDAWPADENALGFAKSSDGGATWEAPARILENIRGIRNTATGKNMRVNSFPVLAADISSSPYRGNLYAVWTNVGVPGTNSGTDKDVYIIKSEDDGETWSTPLKVNQDASGLGKEHYFPWITCDPETGDLHVIFYDDRNVTSTQCEVFVASSYDGGETWEDYRVSDVSFTPAPIAGLASGYFGDYIGISARGGMVYPVWTDNRETEAMA
ncbi:MAG: exo-alpha-sialidase, partial [Calditrichia bacterium]|nr:exo-alpha-sialidase [Calditrichia bacterium]